MKTQNNYREEKKIPRFRFEPNPELGPPYGTYSVEDDPQPPSPPKDLNEAERNFWRDLAKKCAQLAEIEKPRARAMAVEAMFGNMHGDDHQYANEGRDPINSVDDPENGGFREMDYGVVRAEIVERENTDL
jgi:hypothetical protein